LHSLAKQGYENHVAAVVAKLLLEEQLNKAQQSAQNIKLSPGWGFALDSQFEKRENLYKIAHSDVTAKPEIAFKLLKRLVGERGFEPPTPWSRTRFQSLVKLGEIEQFEMICDV